MIFQKKRDKRKKIKEKHKDSKVQRTLIRLFICVGVLWTLHGGDWMGMLWLVILVRVWCGVLDALV